MVQRRHLVWKVIPNWLCLPMTGTGGTGLAALPIRLDTLRHAGVVALVAAKFHSAAVTAEGKLLTWGWGRGGRLGERWEALADECMHVLGMTRCGAAPVPAMHSIMHVSHGTSFCLIAGPCCLQATMTSTSTAVRAPPSCPGPWRHCRGRWWSQSPRRSTTPLPSRRRVTCTRGAPTATASWATASTRSPHPASACSALAHAQSVCLPPQLPTARLQH